MRVSRKIHIDLRLASSTNYPISGKLEGCEKGKKSNDESERERERERAREPRGTQSVLRTCPECQSSKPPQKEYKNRAREARLGSRGNVSGRETGTEPEREEHGNYFRTVKPACEEGDASRHARIKGYLAE